MQTPTAAELRRRARLLDLAGLTRMSREEHARADAAERKESTDDNWSRYGYGPDRNPNPGK